jgi:cytochrome c biogenesis protein CcdA
VLQLALLIVSIGLVDSLNPGTIVPGLYFATGPQPGRRTLGFAAGVFAVNLVAGLALLGPGQLALDALPHVGDRAKHLVELALGVAALICSGLVWRARERLQDRFAQQGLRANRASLLVGATITVLELPTAVPYLAVIAAVAKSGGSVVSDAVLLALFNLTFIAPVLVLAALGRFSSDRAARMTAVRTRLLAHAGSAVAGLLLVISIGLVVIGSLGLA